jgi:hypothetical protein
MKVDSSVTTTDEGDRFTAAPWSAFILSGAWNMAVCAQLLAGDVHSQPKAWAQELFPSGHFFKMVIVKSKSQYDWDYLLHTPAHANDSDFSLRKASSAFKWAAINKK